MYSREYRGFESHPLRQQVIDIAEKPSGIRTTGTFGGSPRALAPGRCASGTGRTRSLGVVRGFAEVFSPGQFRSPVQPRDSTLGMRDGARIAASDRVPCPRVLKLLRESGSGETQSPSLRIPTDGDALHEPLQLQVRRLIPVEYGVPGEFLLCLFDDEWFDSLNESMRASI